MADRSVVASDRQLTQTLHTQSPRSTRFFSKFDVNWSLANQSKFEANPAHIRTLHIKPAMLDDFLDHPNHIGS